MASKKNESAPRRRKDWNKPMSGSEAVEIAEQQSDNLRKAQREAELRREINQNALALRGSLGRHMG